MSLPIKASYALFYRRNTNMIPHELEFFIIDCYVGIKIPFPDNTIYTEVTTNTDDPIRKIEKYYLRRTDLSKPINSSTIKLIRYSNKIIYVSPNYEKDNIIISLGDPPRTNNHFNFTNLPGGGFEDSDNTSNPPGCSPRGCSPQLKNVCRELFEELGIPYDVLINFFMRNDTRYTVETYIIGGQSVFVYLVDLDRIAFEYPSQEYIDVITRLDSIVRDPAQIPQPPKDPTSGLPFTNEYYRARWILEKDIRRSGKVYTDKFKPEFKYVINSTIPNLATAQSHWIPASVASAATASVASAATASVASAAAAATRPSIRLPSTPSWGSYTSTVLGLTSSKPVAAAAAAKSALGPSTSTVLGLSSSIPEVEVDEKTGEDLEIDFKSHIIDIFGRITTAIGTNKVVNRQKIFKIVKTYFEEKKIDISDIHIIKLSNRILNTKIKGTSYNDPTEQPWKDENFNAKQKYLKYKQKYLELKKQLNQN
jgi:hypothetical protein